MIDQRKFYDEVGNRVRTHRAARHMSQAMLGEKVNLKRSSISNIEAGRQKMLLHTLAEISVALNVPLSHLMPEMIPMAANTVQGGRKPTVNEKMWIDALLGGVSEREE